jgi:hypothetical protein
MHAFLTGQVVILCHYVLLQYCLTNNNIYVSVRRLACLCAAPGDPPNPSRRAGRWISNYRIGGNRSPIRKLRRFTDLEQ